MSARRIAAVLAACVTFAAPARGQALPAGEGSITISHAFYHSGVHFNRTGGADRLGRETFHVLFTDVLYGVTDRLSIGGTAAWMATKWTGPDALRHGPLDTGVFHQSWQDARIEARYAMNVGRLSITPFAGAGGPMTGYEVRGHSAFGRGLSDVQVGVDVGQPVRRLGHLDASVAYAFVERAPGADFDMDRISGEVGLGRPVSSRVYVRGVLTWQLMRDGLQVPIAQHESHHREFHDRLARASYLQLGGMVSVPVTMRLRLNAGGFGTVRGKNIHSVLAVVSGVTWAFGGGLRVVDR